MATKTTKVCDVFGTCKDVARFRLTLVPIDDEGSVIEGPEGFPEAWERDLSNNALVRLGRFIRRGVNPPTKADEETEADSPA